MRDARKKAGGPTEAGRSSGERAARNAVGDSASKKLAKIGTSVGNDELQRRLSTNNASRDELLAFLGKRLETLRHVQEQEVSAARSNDFLRENWSKISDQYKSDAKAPDPTRWRESAALYEEAAYQLGRGALGRGQQLVQRAIEAEKKAFDSMTELVTVDESELELDASVEAPEAVADDGIAENAVCAECAVPPEIAELAREIQNVTESAPEVNWRRRTRDPWWTEDEEEEEEEGADGGGS